MGINKITFTHVACNCVTFWKQEYLVKSVYCSMEYTICNLVTYMQGMNVHTWNNDIIQVRKKFANKTSHSHMIHSFCPTVLPTFNMQCSLLKCLHEKWLYSFLQNCNMMWNILTWTCNWFMCINLKLVFIHVTTTLFITLMSHFKIYCKGST